MRLTIRNSDGSVSQPLNLNWAAALERLADYEDTGLEPNEVAAKLKWADETCLALNDIFGVAGVFDFGHIKALLQAEKDGRLVVLPCKVGDTIYLPVVDRIEAAIIHRIEICGHGILFDLVQYKVFAETIKMWCAGCFTVRDIGKTVFLTREEAEVAGKGGDEE